MDTRSSGLLLSGFVKTEQMNNNANFSRDRFIEIGRYLSGSGKGGEKNLRAADLILIFHAFQNMREMVIVTGLDREILYVNEAVRDLLGYGPEELIGKKSDEFFEGIPGNPGKLTERIEREASGGLWEGDIFNLRQDGRLITVKLNLSAIKDEAGKVVGYVGVTRDISKRKEAEEKIKRLNRVLRAVRNVNQIIVKEKDRSRLLRK